MKLNLSAEPSAQAWAWRAAIGPAQVLDGLCYFMTGGLVSLGLGLATARRLSRSRFQAANPMCSQEVSP